MYKSESIAKLAEALSKAQAEIKAAEMNATNPFLKNKYADLGAIIEAARPALASSGLSFTQLVGGDATSIILETMLMHSSGEYIGSTVSLPVGDDKGRSLAQNAGAIITYLRRYSLAALLGVYADEDTDGAQAERKQAQKPADQPKPPAGGPPAQRVQLAPADLKNMLYKKAETAHKGHRASQAQRGLFVGMLDAMFAGDEDKRHTVQAYLFGTPESAAITDPFILAGLDWIKAEKDSGGAYMPDHLAVLEANAVYTEALQGEGQQQLFEGE